MSQPTTIAFGDVVVGIGNGASPEVFAEPCGFNSKSFDCDAATSTVVVPDCDDPDAAPWEIAGVSSKSWTITGEGVLGVESYPTWVALYDAGVPFNVRVSLGSLGYWQGPAVLTKIGHAVAFGSDAAVVKLTINIRNAGAATWHAGA